MPPTSPDLRGSCSKALTVDIYTKPAAGAPGSICRWFPSSMATPPAAAPGGSRRGHPTREKPTRNIHIYQAGRGPGAVVCWFLSNSTTPPAAAPRCSRETNEKGPRDPGRLAIYVYLSGSDTATCAACAVRSLRSAGCSVRWGGIVKGRFAELLDASWATRNATSDACLSRPPRLDQQRSNAKENREVHINTCRLA